MLLQGIVACAAALTGYSKKAVLAYLMRGQPSVLPRGYRLSIDGRGDLVAGITVAFMLVPQAMAYATLAGLPPVMGLYASVFPLLAYAWVGRSPHLAIGPAALDSLMVASALAAVASPDNAIALASVLALGVGLVQWGAAAARLGRFADALSRPILRGFMSGSAVLIGLSQLPALLAIPSTRGSVLMRLHSLAVHLDELHAPTLILGTTALVGLALLKRFRPQVPAAMVIVVLAIAWIVVMPSWGIPVVGAVPAGLPSLRMPSAAFGDVLELIPHALAIGLVGFVEAVSVARALAARQGTPPPDCNRELAALGTANVVAAGFGAFAITGGLSRSAVNADAGARTPMAGVITAVIVGIALMTLTPVFAYLPQAALAAIIVMAVAGLVDIRPLRTWREDRPGAGIYLVTALATMALGIVWGLALGGLAQLGDTLIRRARRRAS